MSRQKNYVGIDIGHSTIRVVITAQHEERKFTVIGVGESVAEGFRKGHVFDAEAMSNSISTAIEQAEKMAGEPVEQAYISIADSIIDSTVAKGVVAISRADGEIDQVDVDRVLEAASSTSVPNNNEILSSQPLGYMVDQQADIQDPIGMKGIRLEIDTHMMYANEQTVKQLIQAVLHTGVDVLDRIPASLAAGRSVLNAKQRELGCVMLDLGSNGMTMMVYVDGVLVHSKTIPVGCEYVTHDVAIGLKIDREVAERLKIEYGTCRPDDVNPRDVIDLSEFGSNYKQIISRRELAEIIEARLAEMFESVRAELYGLGCIERLPAGLILTGGGSKLPGVVDFARDVVGLPAQYGFPVEMQGLADKVDDPAFASVTGLVLYGSERAVSTSGFSVNPKDLFKGISAWYQSIIQGHK